MVCPYLHSTVTERGERENTRERERERERERLLERGKNDSPKDDKNGEGNSRIGYDRMGWDDIKAERE